MDDGLIAKQPFSPVAQIRFGAKQKPRVAHVSWWVDSQDPVIDSFGFHPNKSINSAVLSSTISCFSHLPPCSSFPFPTWSLWTCFVSKTHTRKRQLRAEWFISLRNNSHHFSLDPSGLASQLFWLRAWCDLYEWLSLDHTWNVPKNMSFMGTIISLSLEIQPIALQCYCTYTFVYDIRSQGRQK